ncbi:EAL domain-containing protein [Massilia endophytica]|uniref:EAL domain-containing protein n=1 Tax=Massilia endophytica TaxID=2899220 RepID=UPI001E599C42|nr:EAL domain-containing protein [Massilia endophytica]UGQ46075.1 EAL domain-containing protein [Massilia endophytica]
MTETPRRPSGLSPLLANAVLLAAYLATGELGLQLALAPGYATPLFLPAGIALAVLVSWGPRLLPGVALGALLLNLVPLARGPLALPDFAHVVAACSAACGATLQAYVAMHAFNRWIRPAIGSGRDVLRFLLLAPLLSLTSSTFSLCGIALSGVLSTTEFAANWLAWWLGDSIGMLLAAPLVWVLIGQPRELWRRRRWVVGLPLALLMAVFVGIFLQVEKWESSQQMQTFNLKSQQASDLLQAKLNEHERFLYAMSRAISGHGEHMNAKDFSNVASGYLDRRDELLSMSWLRPVAREDRAALETWARANVQTNFQIKQITPDRHLLPAPERERYMTAIFIEPADRRQHWGLDLLSEPTRAAMIESAVRSGQPTASAPLRLLSSKPAPGVLVAQSVAVAPGEPPLGVLLIALQNDSYLLQVLKQIGFPHMLARLVDLDAQQDATLFDQLAGPPGEHDFKQELRFGGRRYELTLAPTEAYLAQHRGWQSWTVLTSGLLLTGLLGGLLLMISGERAEVQAQVEDATARLQEREARLQAILDNAADAILTIDAEGRLVAGNAAAGRLFGYRQDQIPGLPLQDLLPVAQGETPSQLLRSIASGESHEHEATGWRSDGAPFPLAVSVSEVVLPRENLFVAILHDLTEQHRAQERIYRLAHHDPLTGLDNRLSLNLRLDQLLAQTRRAQGTAAVMFLDLDHFKKINDTHGHQTGDLLLVAVANRLRELLREVDTIARLGGDEFIVVTSGTVTPDETSAIAIRIVEALSAPYLLQGKTVHSGASVGVAMFPMDGEDGNTLLRNADTAMYAAKSRGRNNFQFFSAAMNTATHERLMLENRLWQALEKEEFEIYLQAQIDLDTQTVIGAEALLRWHHPELGLVSPDRFIPIAEESGLILPLGDWVLQHAVHLLDRWSGMGLGHLRLAVNLSARQCHGSALLPQLDRLVADSGIDPSLLEMEITESAAMQDPERSRALLKELRTRGIKVAIDDFGTGYSSLSYLKLFEIDRIKIDRGFVKDIESDPNDAVIVAATIGLAHSLGLDVIAEGVETQAQSDFLRNKHCKEAQGYLFARPVPVHEFERMALKVPPSEEAALA